jgi:endonuclease/exonuclease/phosphatase family metal-dependent hydrolase
LPRSVGRARIAAWNVRWFPDGEPGRRRGKHPTDSAWLGCALAYLDADVFTLEEVKGHPRARAELDDVLREAGRLTGSEFRVRLDDCQPDVAQHVALVWNATRVKVEDFQDFGELNPLDGPCQNHLRPGLGARFRFPGGLDLEIVAVHLKSGTEARSAALRERSLARFPELLARIEAQHHDGDVLVAGDFNVMGCPLCAGLREGPDELAKVRSALANRERPWRVLSPKPACSHYFSRRAGLLDLMVLPADMKEIGPSAELVASGLCAELGCRALPRELPAAYRTLSDHCPIVLDLSDRDLD